MNIETSLLTQINLAIGKSGVRLASLERCYVHHSLLPVALVGYALADPGFAKARFPDTEFLHLVRKRPQMDMHETGALAALCGADAVLPSWDNPEPFSAHLFGVIDKYNLGAFFVYLERNGGSPRHYALRPRGFDWDSADPLEIPGAIDQWRRSYRALPTERQLMVATIMTLYLQRDDKRLMVRVPKKWHAVDGVLSLRDAGYLQDWAKLVALYPGW